MLRSCLRAVSALERLPGSSAVAPWTTFTNGVVQTPALKARAVPDAEREKGRASGGMWNVGMRGAKGTFV